MADPNYAIDFNADLTPALALLAAARNQKRANKRADANLEFQVQAHADNMRRAGEKESHERKIAEEALKYNRSKEAWSQRDALFRAAQRSVPGANANPFGYRFDETRDLPANVEGPEFSPAAEEARFSRVASAAQPTVTEQPVEAQLPSPEIEPGMPGSQFEGPAAPVPMQPSGYQGGGIEAFGDQERQRAADNMDVVGSGLQGDRVVKIDEPLVIDAKPEAPIPQPSQPLMMQAAANTMPGPEGKRRVMGSFQGGQMFELPEQSDKTPYGAKYDAIFQGLIDAGHDPMKALAEVAREYRDDQRSDAQGKRLADAIKGRSDAREDQQTFIGGENEKYRQTQAQRLEAIDRAGKYKVQASGPGFKADAANARDMSLLERAGAAVRQTGQFNKLAASDKTVRGIFVNIAAGSVPLQHADAQIQLARFFRQAQPTEGEMHMLYNNLGGTMDKWNQFVARLENGDLSAEQMRQLKASSAAVKREHDEDIHRFMNVAKARLGPGGGFDMMPDQAQRVYESLGAELGLDNLPPLFSVEGGVTLGSGKRPTTAPRGETKSELDKIEEWSKSLKVQK